MFSSNASFRLLARTGQTNPRRAIYSISQRASAAPRPRYSQPFPTCIQRFQSSRPNRSSFRQSRFGGTRASLPTRRTNQYNRQGRSDIPLYFWMTAGVPVAGVIYLYYHYLDTVPLTQRQRWIATSPEFERQLGDQEYENLLRQHRNSILSSDHPASITVKRVGMRIHRAAREFVQEHLPNDRQAQEIWNAKEPTFTVVRSEMANAFVLPNHHIFVMTGLFQYAQDEDEIASVIGHEMAHNLARHVGEKVSGNLVVQGLARLSLLVDPTGTLMLFFVPAANLLRELPHSRIQELEADHIGMHLAAKACYDPAAAQRVFRRMKYAEGSRAPPQFLSTHPSHDSRLSQMEEWLPEANSIWRRHDEGETCRHLRQEMALARRMAARRGAGSER